MTSADVLIVGGGPGGAVCARALARAGLDVVVLDKAVFPRPKPCAGWITPEVFPLLGWRADDYGGTLQRFRGVVVRRGERVVVTDYGETVSFGILRSEFDHRILREAAAVGARIHEGTRVDRVELRPDGAEVEAGGGKFRARVVVGAGGHFCPIARRAGYRAGERAVAAIEAETRIGPVPSSDPGAERLELILVPGLVGYAWVVRKGEHLNVGVGGLCPDVKARFTALLRHLEELRILDAKTLAPARGHAYRVFAPEHARATVGDGWILVGDAGGFARPISGEGIRTAIESGLDAAATIAGALRDRATVSRESLSGYPAMLLARYGGAGPLPRVVEALARPLVPAASRVVLGIPFLRRKILAERIFGLHPLAR